MSRRITKVNELIKRTLGEIFLKEAELPPDVLVTISRVDTTPNLKSSEIWLYIQPIERAGEVVERLNSQIYDLQGELNRALDARPLPRIRLRIDYGAEHADQIEQAIKRIHEEDGENPG